VDLHVPDKAREENLFYDVTLKRPKGREAKQQLRKPVFVLGQEKQHFNFSFSFEKWNNIFAITAGPDPDTALNMEPSPDPASEDEQDPSIPPRIFVYTLPPRYNSHKVHLLFFYLSFPSINVFLQCRSF
jgi:hypothetical protein